MEEKQQRPIPLTGEALLQKVKEFPNLTKREIAKESGYYTLNDDGQIKVNLTEFYNALLAARGLVKIAYSSSVNGALSHFRAADQQGISAWEIVKEVLKLHGEYGQKRGEIVKDAPGPFKGIKKPVSQWMEEVVDLFDPEKVPILHGRVLILGLHRLDLDLRKYLNTKHTGFVNAIEKELQEPFEKLLEIKFRATISGYSADDLSGDDLLEIDPDVNTLATLICAKTITPPLSVGLFGKWGSGKSFFMQRLKGRVDQISKGARESGLQQKDISFYQHIVQIEFNAWHYSESNLWASLVEHIFENLRIFDGEDASVVEKRRKALLEKMNLEQLAKNQAIKAEKKAQEQVKLVSKKIDDIKNERKKKEDNISDLIIAGTVASINLPEIRNEVNKVFQSLNLDTTSLSDSAVELRSSLREAQFSLEQSGKLISPLIFGDPKRRKERIVNLALAIFVGPVIGAFIWFFLQIIGHEDAGKILAIITASVTFFSKIGKWLSDQLKIYLTWMSKVEDTKDKLEAAIEQEKIKQLSELKKLEQELQSLESEYKSAQQERLAAQERVSQVQEELAQTTAPRLLSQFIQERVSSSNYRQHLGILALIRRDFMKLSNLMEEDLRNLEEELLDDVGEAPPDRINRIVLYIDDLDRCPSETVVTVLQAIHLLLAFPLFVVVVGVDARWISRSLSEHYQQLRPVEQGSLPEEIQSLGNEATPHDYIEKIFQIPFWLKPMEKEGTKNFIRGLLEESLVKESSREGDMVGPYMGEQHENLAQGIQEVTRSLPPQDWKPKILEIEQYELLFAEKLAPILGRSPRSIKRFINVYRLVKIGIPSSEAESFLKEEDLVAPYKLVMFLLAIATGLPSLSRKFFRSLLMDSDSVFDNEIPTTLESLVHKLEEDSSQSMKVELQQLGEWLSSDEVRGWTVIKLSHLSVWAPQVARYSFQVGL